MKTRKACDWCNGLGVLSIRTDQGDNETVTCEKCTYPKAEHTPTPWSLNDPIKTEIVSGYGSTDICVAQNLREADATFIVRCVNSHASLKAFLKAFVEYENSQEASPVNLVMDAQKLLDKLEADK